ncbi:hypothetical protein CFP56_039576 [Quercus suber]|uniref:Uncharacterized protein n=1 Tax=Quercus suber TaxID=58331 RepID=A0AAW0J063_QUESU
MSCLQLWNGGTRNINRETPRRTLDFIINIIFSKFDVKRNIRSTFAPPNHSIAQDIFFAASVAFAAYAPNQVSTYDEMGVPRMSFRK